MCVRARYVDVFLTPSMSQRCIPDDGVDEVAYKLARLEAPTTTTSTVGGDGSGVHVGFLYTTAHNLERTFGPPCAAANHLRHRLTVSQCAAHRCWRLPMPVEGTVGEVEIHADAVTPTVWHVVASSSLTPDRHQHLVQALQQTIAHTLTPEGWCRRRFLLLM